MREVRAVRRDGTIRHNGGVWRVEWTAAPTPYVAISRFAQPRPASREPLYDNCNGARVGDAVIPSLSAVEAPR